jgi:hypothetical protein
VSIAISDTANFCGTVMHGFWPGDWSGLKLTLWSFDDRGNILPPTSGTYAINGLSGKVAAVRYSLEDNVCAEDLAAKVDGVSGNIVVTTGPDGAWSGNYDVVFDNSDHVTGSFSAAYCPVLGASTFVCNYTATPAVAGTVSGATGSIHGNAITPVDAMVNFRVAADGGAYAQLNLFDQPAICGGIQSFHYPSGLGHLLINLFDSSGNETMDAVPPVAPGTFPVLETTVIGLGSDGAYFKADSSYRDIDADSAQIRGGSVTLTSVSGGIYAGSYDLTMDSGDHVSGSFTAPYCPDY